MAEAPLPSAGVRASLERSPVVGVVRVGTAAEALAQAHSLSTSGLELVEITFTVPGAIDVLRELRASASSGDGTGVVPRYGMGTVTDAGRAERAVAAGAEFLVTPNVSPEVARIAKAHGIFLVMGALTPTEIVEARRLGADLVKVYPLPPVGGTAYLETVRQPLNDIPILAAGGFGVEEIPAYARAGAVAFGIGGPLFGPDEMETARRVRRALSLARGEEG